MTILPNTRGHYPPGYPVNGAPNPGRDPATNLEMAPTDTPDLDLIKAEILELQNTASWYLGRQQNAANWLNSRWDGQTADARKWAGEGVDADKIFPWNGSSDSRVRLAKMISNEHRTVESYALMNMKLQAKSSRPAALTRDSQQATTLLNWQIFTALQAEWHRESRLALAWRRNNGASVIEVGWEQERRLDTIPINVMQFGEWIGLVTGQQFQLLDVQDMLNDKEQEKELLTLIQAMSPVVTRARARSLLRDLQQLRAMEVPIANVFRSQPRLTALRPMVDVFFDPSADDLQRERWVDRVEWVTETTLRDRIETDNYDPGFVDKALEQRGGSGEMWATQERGAGLWDGDGASQGSSNGLDRLIPIHHFYWKAIDLGTPVLYRTVFAMNVPVAATHGPCEFDHGQMPFHALRFETEQRPILSSMGIPELSYTWEQELKVQVDGRTDRVSLTLAPPMFSDYADVLRMKASFMPKAIIPMRRGTEPRFMQPPQYDPGSIQVSNDIVARADRFFGLFGEGVDPQLKQMRQMEYIDDVLTELKPVFGQVLKLDKQYLPDAEVAAVVGPLSRPFHVSRREIQGEHEISATVDLRNLDVEFLKEKFGFLAQLKQMDTGGVLDANKLVRNGAESIDYTLADEAVQDTGAATNKEITDEIGTANRIIGSGMPEPLPQGGNYKLRMDALQNHLQSADPQNPSLQRGDVQKVLQNRMEFFQRQLQQEENAQIGRLQVTAPFSKDSPEVAPGLPTNG